MRTTEILLEKEDVDQIESVVGVGPMMSAIQYLSTYAITADRFQNVKIYRDGKTDFLGVYEDEEAGVFVIGAVWRSEEKRYTFHT